MNCLHCNIYCNNNEQLFRHFCQINHGSNYLTKMENNPKLFTPLKRAYLYVLCTSNTKSLRYNKILKRYNISIECS